MAASSFAVDQPVQDRPGFMIRVFPRFSVSTFTFAVSLVQTLYYVLSVLIGGGFLNPTDCALYTLGANVIPI